MSESKAEKIETGFKLGTKKVTVLSTVGQYTDEDGKIHRLVKVRTSDGNEYFSMRLYNSQGRFIKQYMIRQATLPAFIALYQKATLSW